ncbi:MAG: DsbA family protein [Rhodospirillaceae bacterium]|nr:DsbA family protein [Rhodospirillaceae bacterium]
MKTIVSFMMPVLAMAVLSAGPALAQDKSAFTPAQREEMKTLVRDYLLENPEVIADAIGKLQEREEAKKEQERMELIAKRKDELVNPKEQTYLGNLQGDVTIVEFFDYNCGYCKSMFPDLIQLVKSDGRIRLVMKEFPILGPQSVTATKAALASRNQRKYSEFHQALLAYKGGLNEAAINTVAKGVGLNVEKLQEDMKDTELDKLIKDNRDLAQALGITGTPALLIGDTFIGGAIGRDKLSELVAAARKKG